MLPENALAEIDRCCRFRRSFDWEEGEGVAGRDARRGRVGGRPSETRMWVRRRKAECCRIKMKRQSAAGTRFVNGELTPFQFAFLRNAGGRNDRQDRNHRGRRQGRRGRDRGRSRSRSPSGDGRRRGER